MSICTESTTGPRELVSQVLVAVGFFLGQRVKLQKKYDYPYNSDPGLGRTSTDTLLTTGIAVKFD